MPGLARGTDLVIVGCGVAGMSALLSAAETAKSFGSAFSIVALEASHPEIWGGSSRWTGAHLRMSATDQIVPNFVEDFLNMSGGKADENLVRALAERAVETIAWVRSKGVEFEKQIANVASGSSIRPKGFGLALISALRAEAEKLGGRIFFETKALSLARSERGMISGVWARRPRSTKLVKISCKAVILATGGFAGNPRLLSKYVGKWASTLSVAAPGTRMCKGDGIRMALGIGAKPSGQYDSFQGKVVDARSKMFDPFLQILQFGVLVNQRGESFVSEDSPSGEISDLFNYFGKSIARQTNQLAYLILDQATFSAVRSGQLPQQDSLVRSDIPPISVQSLEELADIIRVPKKKLMNTISKFNSEIIRGEFKKPRLIAPVSRPPFICYPVKCTIQFTFGGIAIDTQARVISKSGEPIQGLYAAGEVVGMHYKKYLPGALVLSGLVFGKQAGSSALEYIKNLNSPLSF